MLNPLSMRRGQLGRHLLPLPLPRHRGRGPRMRWCWTVTLAAALLLPPAACTATACRPMGPCFARVSRDTRTLRLGGGSDDGAETTGAETRDETRAGTGKGDGAEAGAMAPSDVDGGSGPERWVEVESHEVGMVGDGWQESEERSSSVEPWRGVFGASEKAPPALAGQGGECNEPAGGGGVGNGQDAAERGPCDAEEGAVDVCSDGDVIGRLARGGRVAIPGGDHFCDNGAILVGSCLRAFGASARTRGAEADAAGPPRVWGPWELTAGSSGSLGEVALCWETRTGFLPVVAVAGGPWELRRCGSCPAAVHTCMHAYMHACCMRTCMHVYLSHGR